MCGHSLTLLQSNPDIFCVLYDHGINIYMIDQFLSVYGFYIRFYISDSVCSLEHRV